MQKRSHQTEALSKVNHKSQVRKFKLALAGALLLIVIALAYIAMPLMMPPSSAMTRQSDSQFGIIHPFASPGGGCNPAPNC